MDVRSSGSEMPASSAGAAAAADTDLCQCPWYHGPTTRIASEISLRNDGDFLVRDCISSPGDFVLTSRWRGQTLHFRMNRVSASPSVDGSVASSGGGHLFQFEDEAFATVPELIMHHAANQVGLLITLAR